MLNVIFHAGSDSPFDTDKGLYILEIEKEISYSEMQKIFTETNRLCDTFSDDEDAINFPISYEEGLNISTLMNGIEIYTKGTIKKIENMSGRFEISDVYEIEQWQ